MSELHKCEYLDEWTTLPAALVQSAVVAAQVDDRAPAALNPASSVHHL